MGKKKQHKKPQKTVSQKPASQKPARRLPPEDRRTEAITVAWMLSTTVTFGALFFSGLAALAVPNLADAAGQVGAMGVIPYLLLAVATVTGTVSIILMGCAIRYRRSPPPRPIIIASAIICFFPFAVYLLLAVQ